MGDGRILSKNLRALLFNDDLSNEPYFGRIHLTGQYQKVGYYGNVVRQPDNIFKFDSKSYFRNYLSRVTLSCCSTY